MPVRIERGEQDITFRLAGEIDHHTAKTKRE